MTESGTELPDSFLVYNDGEKRLSRVLNIIP